MEISQKEYKLENKQLSFTVKSKKITGIYTNDKIKLLEITNFKRDMIPNKQKIAIIQEKMDSYIEKMKVYEAMYYEIRKKEISLKDPSKKVKDSLKIVGLNYDYLNRDIRSLSSSETKQLSLALALLSNPNIIIITEPFINYDKETEKKIWLLIQKMRDQYGKTFIFISNDENMLYKYTNHLIIIKNSKVLLEGNPLDIFKKNEYLKKNSIEIPEIIELTYLAKTKKNAKIDYHKDVRDIIKDIYKHV